MAHEAPRPARRRLLAAWAALRPRTTLALAALSLWACGSPPGAVPAKVAPELARPDAAAPSATGPSTATRAMPARTDGRLSLAEARAHMLTLINRDRASEGLSPVVLDEGAAQKAGQRHAEDMARLGFLGHWGSDGSVPEQRHSEAGGVDFVMENAACVTDEKPRDIDAAPSIEKEALERTEGMFFGEVPPNDGHRKNILKAEHKRVGIGIAQTRGSVTELPALCLTQEFIDPYGTYAPLPKQAKAGESLTVSGAVTGNVKFGGVSVGRVDLPKPLAPSDLNKRRSYTFPEPYQIYWPRGYKTPLPVEVHGQNFKITVPLARGPGLYSITILAQHPGQKSYGAISVRTVVVQ